MKKMTIGDRIKHIWEQRTQVEFAKEVGCGYIALAILEHIMESRSTRNPNPWHLER